MMPQKAAEPIENKREEEWTMAVSPGGKNRLSEPAVDKCQLATRVPLKVKYQMLQMYGKPGEQPSETLRRLILDVVKDERLSADSLRRMTEEMKANYDKRMLARAKAHGEDSRNMRDMKRG